MNAELQSWAATAIGKVEHFSLGVIDTLWAQRYAVAVDDLDPLYFDLDYARSLGHPGLVAPPNYVATLRGAPAAGPPEQELLADGMTAAARPPLPGLVAMGGGQSLSFHAPVYCGETITCGRRVLSVDEKPGRSGPLVIIDDELAYRNAAGEPKLSVRNTLLCRWADAR